MSNKNKFRDVVTRPEAQRGIPIGAPRFEYMAVDAGEFDDFNSHGAEGWELVSVVKSTRPDRVVAHFKRPLQ